VLLHAGDFTDKGTRAEVESFNSWLGEVKATNKYKAIVVIAGNHDICCDTGYEGKKSMDFMQIKDKGEGAKLLTNATHVLEGESTTILGVSIFGSAVTPFISGQPAMAFNVERGENGAKKVWEKVPVGTDIVLSHGPPLVSELRPNPLSKSSPSNLSLPLLSHSLRSLARRGSWIERSEDRELGAKRWPPCAKE
jgi:predicted MPP superfamily phosphohydrolase